MTAPVSEENGHLLSAHETKNDETTSADETASKHSLNRLKSATLDGVTARSVEVEATFTKGLPGFTVVGLAGSDIQEAKERVKSALLVNDFVFPPLKITISLAPSELRKSGKRSAMK